MKALTVAIYNVSILIAALLLWRSRRRDGLTLVKVGGRDHVTLEDLAQFYGFTQMQRDGNNFVAHHHAAGGQVDSVDSH